MQINEILPEERIGTGLKLLSKKAVLESLAGMLGASSDELDTLEVFDAFLSRERLGSTGLGKGVAIPHGRIRNITESKGAFIKLTEGIDFDAIDNQKVDMFFALLVPEQSTDEHLKILAQLAEMFSRDDFLQDLRAQNDAAEILAMLTSN